MHFSLWLLLLSLAPHSSFQQETGAVEQRKPFFERLRRLEEQFRRFQEITLQRLQKIAENYNVSYNIDARFNGLSEQLKGLMTAFNASSAVAQGELGSLKSWLKKLQKNNKKLQLKISSMDDALGERSKQSSILSNLTQELSNQRNGVELLQSSGRALQKEIHEVQALTHSQAAKLAHLQEQLQNQILLPQTFATPQYKPQEANKQRSMKKLQAKHSQRRKLQETHLLPSPREPGNLQEIQQFSTPVDSRNVQEVHRFSSPQGRENQKEQHRSPTHGEPGNLQEVHQLPSLREAGNRKDFHRFPVLGEPGNLQETHQLPRPGEPRNLQEIHKFPIIGEPGNLQPLEQPSQPERKEEESPASKRLPNLAEVQPAATKEPAKICNVDSMLVFPNASIQNFASFSRGFQAGILEFSICSWVSTEAGYLGTLLSYATEENDNKLVLHGRKSPTQSSIHFVIGDPAFRELPVQALLDGRWHHICVIWSSIEGKYWYYIDRRLASTGSKFQKGYEIPAGGSLVLGQEQDTVAGGFDSSEAFVGNVAGFMVWSRALSPGEVSSIATGKSRPRGTILTLGDISALHGLVQKVNCTCLEHCV
ncbi:pentraxin-4 [Rhinatrema bivittatum]|uniref:pentraxin-4 n=1 Tax=Rhinatrema bivittatum TaxID=194408 RepID=UPI00112BD026|nr:pentraxin-4 [Rhinatrema bivittatum]